MATNFNIDDDSVSKSRSLLSNFTMSVGPIVSVHKVQRVVAFFSFRYVSPVKHCSNFFLRIDFWRVVVAEKAISCFIDLLSENLKCLFPRSCLGPPVNLQNFAEDRSGFFIHSVEHCLSSLLFRLVSKAQINYVKVLIFPQLLVDPAHKKIKPLSV